MQGIYLLLGHDNRRCEKESISPCFFLFSGDIDLHAAISLKLPILVAWELVDHLCFVWLVQAQAIVCACWFAGMARGKCQSEPTLIPLAFELVKESDPEKVVAR